MGSPMPPYNTPTITEKNEVVDSPIIKGIRQAIIGRKNWKPDELDRIKHATIKQVEGLHGVYGYCGDKDYGVAMYLDAQGNTLLNVRVCQRSPFYQGFVEASHAENIVKSKGVVIDNKGNVSFRKDFHDLMFEVIFITNHTQTSYLISHINEPVEEVNMLVGLKLGGTTLIDMVRFGDRIRTKNGDWYKKYHGQALAKLPEQCADPRYDIKEEDIKFLYQSRVDGKEVISKEFAAKCIQILRKRITEQEKLKQHKIQSGMKLEAKTHTKLASLSTDIVDPVNIDTPAQLMYQIAYRVDNTLSA